MNLRFEISGSSPEPYVVLLSKTGENLKITCDCPAGSRKQHCKHRYNLLAGDASNVVGGDIQAVSMLPNLLKGTDVEEAIAALQCAEEQLADAKKQVSAAKKAVAEAMDS